MFGAWKFIPKIAGTPTVDVPLWSRPSISWSTATTLSSSFAMIRVDASEGVVAVRDDPDGAAVGGEARCAVARSDEGDPARGRIDARHARPLLEAHPDRPRARPDVHGEARQADAPG